MIDLLRSYGLRSDVWSGVKISTVPIEDDKWGPLEPLRGTVWGAMIPIVPGDAVALAKYGHIQPLMKVLGRPPDGQLRLLPDPFRRCENHTGCASYRARDCQPCTKMPDCYEAPGMSPEASRAAALVALAWRDGIYVALVDGPEFTF
jgi:hypothetical protein